jgi:archaetidylinositol phosphate synthase
MFTATVESAAQVRVNDGWLAATEKRLLIRMARQLPAWLNSDHLTALALAAMAGAGAAFWAARFWRPALALVVAALAVNWFGDSLDGTVARVRKQERPRYGFYVDHVLDVTGITLLMTGLALSGFMTPTIALAVLAAYLLVSAEVFLATAVHGVFRMSFLNVGPTELRLVLAAGALTLWTRPLVTPFGFGPYLLFDVGGCAAVAGLLAALLTSTVRNTVMLFRAEPRRGGAGSGLRAQGSRLRAQG